MNPIKRLFGMAPTPDETGRGYIPSPLGRLLVLCTEDRYLEMTNGTLFSTGQNAQETAVPLMHLVAAGFDFDVVTPTGAPAVIEEWSAPSKDEAVLGFLADHRAAFDRPLSLRELVAQGALDDDSPYVALFLPGGHGAMVGLPENPNVGALIRWVEESDRYLVATFPDSLDERSPSLGYLPGDLPWLQRERLEAQGIRIVNDKANGTTHIDRKLYSGDSPKACDQLGKQVAEALLADVGAATQHTTTTEDSAWGSAR